VLNIFSAPIYSKILNLETKKLREYCIYLKENIDSVNISNRGGWQSPSLEEEDHPVLNNLISEIYKSGEKYRETISYKYPLKIENMWINVNGNKDYNVQHIHHYCVVSGVYYLTSNNSNIVFINPAAPHMEYDWCSDVIEKYNEHNSPSWMVPPVENQLLLFPSWLSHRVEPNLTEGERISISFNLAR
tara:strand:+ start:359 stop:922 length:564 start_codon:yes stop_codon:yes gene_type:complete